MVALDNAIRAFQAGEDITPYLEPLLAGQWSPEMADHPGFQPLNEHLVSQYGWNPAAAMTADVLMPSLADAIPGIGAIDDIQAVLSLVAALARRSGGAAPTTARGVRLGIHAAGGADDLPRRIAGWESELSGLDADLQAGRIGRADWEARRAEVHREIQNDFSNFGEGFDPDAIDPNDPRLNLMRRIESEAGADDLPLPPDDLANRQFGELADAAADDLPLPEGDPARAEFDRLSEGPNRERLRRLLEDEEARRAADEVAGVLETDAYKAAIEDAKRAEAAGDFEGMRNAMARAEHERNAGFSGISPAMDPNIPNETFHMMEEWRAGKMGEFHPEGAQMRLEENSLTLDALAEHEARYPGADFSQVRKEIMDEVEEIRQLAEGERLLQSDAIEQVKRLSEMPQSVQRDLVMVDLLEDLSPESGARLAETLLGRLREADPSPEVDEAIRRVESLFPNLQQQVEQMDWEGMVRRSMDDRQARLDRIDALPDNVRDSMLQADEVLRRGIYDDNVPTDIREIEHLMDTLGNVESTEDIAETISHLWDKWMRLKEKEAQLGGGPDLLTQLWRDVGDVLRSEDIAPLLRMGAGELIGRVREHLEEEEPNNPLLWPGDLLQGGIEGAEIVRQMNIDRLQAFLNSLLGRGDE